MPAKEVTDIVVQEHHRTDKAILVSDTGDKEDAVWLPFSQIEMEPVPGKSGFLEITLPVWLAQDKGLI